MEEYKEKYISNIDDPEEYAWWDILLEAFNNKTPICYEAAEFITEEMMGFLESQGWVDGVVWDSGAIYPPGHPEISRMSE